MIIQSGRFPEFLKASTTSSRLMMRARFCPEDSLKAFRRLSESFSRSIACKSSWMASAPIPTRNEP